MKTGNSRNLISSAAAGFFLGMFLNIFGALIAMYIGDSKTEKGALIGMIVNVLMDIIIIVILINKFLA